MSAPAFSAPPSNAARVWAAIEWATGLHPAGELDTPWHEVGDDLTRCFLIGEVERAFAIDLSDDRIETIRTVGDLVRLCEDAMSAVRADMALAAADPAPQARAA